MKSATFEVQMTLFFWLVLQGFLGALVYHLFFLKRTRFLVLWDTVFLVPFFVVLFFILNDYHVPSLRFYVFVAIFLGGTAYALLQKGIKKLFSYKKHKKKKEKEGACRNKGT